MTSSSTGTEDVWSPEPEHVSTVDAVTSEWRQGDIVDLPLSVWVADKSRPLTKEAFDATASGSAVIVKQAPKSQRVVVVSQSCDVVKKSARPGKEPWTFVQVCPVVDLTGDPLLGEAAGGHSTRFAPLPGIGTTMFADLNVCTTFEKSMLVGLKRIEGCVDDDQRWMFSSVVGRNRARFAFPDGTDEVLNPLRDWFRGKWKKDSAEGRAIAYVREVRVRRAAATPWNASTVDIELIFIIEPAALPRIEDDESAASSDLVDWAKTPRSPNEVAAKLELTAEPVDRDFVWQQLAKAWVAKCGKDSRLILLGASAESGLVYPIARSWVEPRLEFDHLSSPF